MWQTPVKFVYDYCIYDYTIGSFSEKLDNYVEGFISYDEIFEKLDNNQFLWQFTFSEIENNSAMKKKWENYTNEKAYAENIEFQDPLIAIKELMTELFSENLTVKRYK